MKLISRKIRSPSTNGKKCDNKTEWMKKLISDIKRWMMVSKQVVRFHMPQWSQDTGASKTIFIQRRADHFGCLHYRWFGNTAEYISFYSPQCTGLQEEVKITIGRTLYPVNIPDRQLAGTKKGATANKIRRSDEVNRYGGALALGLQLNGRGY